MVDRARCEHIRALAREIVRKHKVRKPGTPICDILKTEGIEVVFRNWGKSFRVGGLLYRQERLVAINADDDPRRQRFSMAHEFGHYILGHDHLHGRTYVDIDTPPDDLSPPDDDSDSEIEANHFANEILVPRPFLLEFRPTKRPPDGVEYEAQPFNNPFAMLSRKQHKVDLSPEELGKLFIVNPQVIYRALTYHNLL